MSASQTAHFDDCFEPSKPQTFRKRLLSLALSFFLIGCTMRSCSGATDIPPEDQLTSYISLAVNIVNTEQRQELIELTTGNLRQALVNATDESFKRAYIDKKYDFKSFEILQRQDVPGKKEVLIDFKLVYKSWNAGEAPERAPLLEATNRATMIYERGHWALARVESLESSFEWENGLPLDNVEASNVNPDDPPKEVQSSRQIHSDLEKETAAPEEQPK